MHVRTLTRRLTVVCAGTIGLIFATPGVASAHNVGSIKATNYHSAVDALSPSIPGVTLTIAELGNKLELTNDTTTEVLVLGYQDEPYLRVSKAGVFTNENSPSYYSNQSTTGASTFAVVPTDQTGGPPDWHKTSTGDTAIWHDHRTHWMAGINPPEVRAHPDASHVVIPQWTVDMKYGNEPLAASGTLTWVPSPNPLPSYVLCAASFALGIAAGFGARGRFNIVIALTALVVVDIAHTLGQLFEFVGSASSILGRAGPAILPSIAAWIVGIYGAKKVSANASDGPWYGLFAALIIGLLSGVSDFDTITHSQVPFAWNASIVRALISISTGLGLGLTITFANMLRRERNTAVQPEPITPET